MKVRTFILILISSQKLNIRFYRIRCSIYLFSLIFVEYTKYVLNREKIVETSYMIDLGSLEEQFHASLVTQFSFICFFSPFFVLAGLVSFLINLVVISLTVKIYTDITRRPISRRVSDIGIWKGIYGIIGYVGVIFNTLMVAKLNNGIKAFTSWDHLKNDGLAESTARRDVSAVDTEIIYIVMFGVFMTKIGLSMIIPKLPRWIERKISREKLSKQRDEEEYSTMVKKLLKRSEKNGRVLLNRQKKSLKFFFENQKEIKNHHLDLGFGHSVRTTLSHKHLI